MPAALVLASTEPGQAPMATNINKMADMEEIAIAPYRSSTAGTRIA